MGSFGRYLYRLGIYDKLGCWGWDRATPRELTGGFAATSTTTNTVGACTVPPPRSSAVPAVSCVEGHAGSRDQDGYRMQRHDAGEDDDVPCAALALNTGLLREERSRNGARNPHRPPKKIPRRYEGTSAGASLIRMERYSADLRLGAGSAILPGRLTPDPRGGSAAIRPEVFPPRTLFPHAPLGLFRHRGGQTEGFSPPCEVGTGFPCLFLRRRGVGGFRLGLGAAERYK